MRKLSGGPVGSLKKLKASVTSSAGLITFIPEAGVIVRFLHEPTEWYEFKKHFTGNKQVLGCYEDCGLCRNGEKPTRRYLASALDVTTRQIIAVELPVTVVEILLKRYEKYNTLMDRDYELSKSGSGQEGTRYDVETQAPSRINLNKYDPLDLEKILAKEFNVPDDDDEDTEDDEPPRRSSRTSSAKPRRRTPMDEDYDDEDENDDDEEEAPPRRNVRSGNSAPVRRPRPRIDDDEEAPRRKPVAGNRPLRRRK